LRPDRFNACGLNFTLSLAVVYYRKFLFFSVSKVTESGWILVGWSRVRTSVASYVILQ
jgi:hypothetical protein